MGSERVLLVADDEPDFLSLYRRLFGRDGFRIVTAATLKEALARSRRSAFTRS